MTYREFRAEQDRLLAQIRELADRTTAESLAALSDDAFEAEVEYLVYLDNKHKKLCALLDGLPRRVNKG
jgi:hypothetical protein